MSPLRWDVLLVSFLLAIPVLALGLRGDLSAEETTARLPWCLAAGWGAVALIRYAGKPTKPTKPAHEPAAAAEQPTTGDPAPDA